MSRLTEFARTRPWLSFLALLAAVTLLCVVASVLIETKRERIARVITQAKEALEKGDVAEMLRSVSPDFQQEGLDKDGLGELMRSCLRAYGHPTIRLWVRQLKLEGESVTCELSVRFAFPEYHGGIREILSRSRWRVSLRKQNDRWLITELTPLSMEGYEPGGLVPLAKRYRVL